MLTIATGPRPCCAEFSTDRCPVCGFLSKESTMTKYTAPSNYDYDDEPWARPEPARETIAAVCPSCGACFETPRDQPQAICRGCLALAELTALLNQQGAA